MPINRLTDIRRNNAFSDSEDEPMLQVAGGNTDPRVHDIEMQNTESSNFGGTSTMFGGQNNLSEYSSLMEDIQQISKAANELDDLKHEYMEKAGSDRIQRIVREVGEVAKRTNAIIRDISSQIKQMKEDNAAFAEANNNTVSQWRLNNQRAATVSFRDAMERYNNALNELNRQMVDKSVRMYQYMMNNETLSNSEKRELENLVFSDPVGAELQLRQKLQRNCSMATKIKLDELSDQNKGVRQIETSVDELKTMFAEIAQLISDQGEELDNISQNVEQSRMMVAKAKGQIETAVDHKAKARKRSVCICLCCIVLLVIVIVPLTSDI